MNIEKYLFNLATDFCKQVKCDLEDLMHTGYKGNKHQADLRACFCFLAVQKEFTHIELADFFGKHDNTIFRHIHQFERRLAKMENKQLVFNVLKEYNVDFNEADFLQGFDN